MGEGEGREEESCLIHTEIIWPPVLVLSAGAFCFQRTSARSTAHALGHSAAVEVKGVKKRVLSAAGRAAILRRRGKRWAKVRKQAKEVTG